MVTQSRLALFTRSQEDYLKALYQLGADAHPVPTGELAQKLGISSPSVSEMVSRLAEQGLVTHDRYRGQQLTEEGRQLAVELVRHHRLIEMFLVQVLGYGWDEVHDEAERLEHVISEQMEERIFEFLGRPEVDPHGHALPSREGDIRQVSSRALSDCQAGETVIVRAVSDDDPARLRELTRLGLVLGARLAIQAGSRYESPIEATRAGKKLSIPLGLARGVFVEAAG